MKILFITAGEKLPIHQITRNSLRNKRTDNFIHVGMVETLLRHNHDVYIFGQNDYDEYKEYLDQSESSFAFPGMAPTGQSDNTQHLINYTNDPNFKLPSNLTNLFSMVRMTQDIKDEMTDRIVADLIAEGTYLKDPHTYVKAKEKEYTYLKYVQDNISKQILESDIKFDLILCKATSFDRHNLPYNVMNAKNGEYYSAKFRTLNYVAPQIDLINKLSDVPLVAFIDDPRSGFLNKYDVDAEVNDTNIGPYDLLNTPKVVCGQLPDDNIHLTRYKQETIDNKVPVDIKTNFDEVTEKVKVPYKYCPIETIFLMRENVWDSFRDFRKIEKKNKFILTAHGMCKRDQYIDKWVLPYVDDEFKVYGRWLVKPEDISLEKPKGAYWSKAALYAKNKHRTEYKVIAEIEDEMWDSRYTFIPTTDIKYSNFVTQKFWRTIFYGIIPFFQAEYDTTRIYDVPEICRPKTPEEMWANMEYLDNNPEERQAILNHLYDMVTDPLLKNGEYFYQSLSQHVRENIGLDMN